jgi:hypothetical protein
MSHRRVGKVLLLHPDDEIHSLNERDYRLVIDLGRAPSTTYERCSRQIRCPMMSLFELADGTADLHRTRELLEFGMGEVVDRFGIDWWDVLAQSIVPQIQQLILLRRLAEKLEAGTDVYCPRPHFLARALQHLLDGELVIVQSDRKRALRTVEHYADALRQLDFAQFTQVIQDKFDPRHAVRRRFASRPRSSARPLVLLPSAYVNVSRMAVAYAAMLPDVEFLLLSARNNGRLEVLPKNVRVASLDGYFSSIDESEAGSLKQTCKRLRLKLAASAPEFEMAEASGVQARLESRLMWGLAVRDAWSVVFDSQKITACLCADDSNPYSRLPLIIAKNRGIPALACHHGALDSRMAIKKQHADFYLTKSEMERDYLVRVCRVAAGSLIKTAPPSPQAFGSAPAVALSSQDQLVFFTEPYHAAGWRTDEVYSDLLPRLVALARECGLELVFKLHPFESARGHRRLLKRHLSAKDVRKVRIVAGPTPSGLWQNIKCALTVQSTVALECRARAIPIFLCGWLADPCSGYVQQYERFGVARILNSPRDLDQIPEWIASKDASLGLEFTERSDSDTLRQLLSGAYSRPAMASA